MKEELGAEQLNMWALLKQIDRKLLPRQTETQFGPYIWLVYLSFFFVSLALHHPVENSFIYASIGTGLFLVVYFNAFWATRNRIHWNIIGIVIIGSLLTSLTPGASVFFVYASAFCCLLGSPRKAVIGIATIAAWVVLLSWIANLGPFFYVPATLFVFLIGGVNIFQHEITLKRKELVLSQQEVRHLARTSERERIARDLHDLIGHTFSVITLKAELANKLLDKDTSRAKTEISALANISREALSQIREVVTGYRSSDLNTELAHAKYVLESNEVSFNYQFEEFDMSEYINKELAIMLKELVTNILKHAESDRVQVSIIKQDNHAKFTIKDNGIGFKESEHQGFGLKGMTERVNKLNGELSIDSSSGTLINIHIPLLESS
jgi:two-component system sensor histidine kinase DesK